MMLKSFKSLIIFASLMAISTLNGWAQTPTNTSVATAKVINSFPYTDTGVNSSLGGSNLGMNGGCVAPCCSTVVYRIEIPANGMLRADAVSFQPLAGSILAYTPDIETPTESSDLSYINTPGNFCGFRDSLQLSGLNAGDVIYAIAFSHNNQTGQGLNTDYVFTFEPDCPDGVVCDYPNVELCDGDGYLSPSGNLYSESGHYIDTLVGAAVGGLDSLVYTNLTINHTDLTQDIIADEELCIGTDSILQSSSTEYSSYLDLNSSDGNWVECNAVVPELMNTNRSIFGWLKKSTTVSGSSQVIVGMNTSGSGNICNLQIGTNEQLGIYDGGTSRYTGKVVTDGLWHHVGYTYDEVTDTTKMYVDGILEGKYKNAQSITALTNRISIGQEFDGSAVGNFLDGQLTEVSMWSEVLDSTDIALLMAQAIEPSHPKYSNLEAYYPMSVACEDDISIVTDFSPNGFNGNASHTDLQSTTLLEEVTGFNSSAHYTKAWIYNESTIATSDSLILPSFSLGDYSLELTRDYFTISEYWTVSLGESCIACTETNATIDTTVCGNYTSPSGSYTWTSSNTYMDTIPNTFGCDSVLTINLTVLLNSSSTDVQEACDTYTWTNGVTYTASNSTAKDTLENAIGCDSIITLNLTILESTNYTDNQEVCDSFTWINGVTYTTSNSTAKDTLENAVGCDSIVSLNLTILESTFGTDTLEACDTYTWTNGTTYTSSNTTAKDTLENAAGCDSIVTLNLTILESTSYTDNQIACDTFTWINGVTYTASNSTAKDTLENAVGCDSIVTLNLTILETTTSIDTQYACESYTWTNGVTYTSSNSTAKDTLDNAAGCDSIVTLNLLLNQPTYTTDNHEACDSFTWINGVIYTASNSTAKDTLENAVGCDSIVTLDLTIKHSTHYTDTVVLVAESYIWIDEVEYTESNSTATYTLQNIDNCDSIVHLNLTLINYCTSRSTRNNYEWIKTVELGDDIDNTSNKNIGGYGDYIDDVLTVDTNETVTVILTPGYRRRVYDEYWRIWADWNYDGDFNDPGEKVFEQHGKNVQSGSFTVPVNVNSNDLRLRVSMRWKRYAPECGNFRNGEVEEYTIRVNGAQGYSSTPIPPTKMGTYDSDMDLTELSELDINPIRAGQPITGSIRVNRMGEHTFKIVNMIGQVVKTTQVNCMEDESDFEISTEGLTQGVYFIQVGLENESTKVIIR